MADRRTVAGNADRRKKIGMASLNSHAEDLAGFWKGEILWDSPMSRFSSLKVGGPAEAILFAENHAELQNLVGWLHDNNVGWQVIGRGSNILVPDEGLPGVVIFLDGEFARFETIENSLTAADKQTVRIRAGGGCLPRRGIPAVEPFGHDGFARLDIQGVQPDPAVQVRTVPGGKVDDAA